MSETSFPVAHVGNGRRFRVLDVVPFGEEDEALLVGLLQVEAAWAPTACGPVPRQS